MCSLSKQLANIKHIFLSQLLAGQAVTLKEVVGQVGIQVPFVSLLEIDS